MFLFLLLSQKINIKDNQLSNLNSNIIEVNNLTKEFGNFIAVDQVSFSVKKGEIFGFLGANGAGKSTTIRMLCGLLKSSSGSAKVTGFDIDKNSEKVKENIGYMSQKFSLYDDLTVEENLTFFGGIYGLENHKLQKRINWALKMADLQDKRNRSTKELSGGWKQRLALGSAVLHEPKIVFLDEPTGGVDPVSRRNFWELINTLSENGITIFVTTHYLDEAEYCNHILLIQAGKIIAGGSPNEMKTKYLSNPIIGVECNDPLKALEHLKKNKIILDVSIFGLNLHVNVVNEKEGIKEIRSTLRKNEISIISVNKIIPSLEDVFIHLIEK
jgi:ABC-2 type transport system ATP-binding protein